MDILKANSAVSAFFHVFEHPLAVCRKLRMHSKPKRSVTAFWKKRAGMKLNIETVSFGRHETRVGTFHLARAKISSLLV